MVPFEHRSCQKIFFPNVESARGIGSIKLSAQMAQVITGHCSLNAHQHRFRFRVDPGCECGAAQETVKHFLFYCPKNGRDDFVLAYPKATDVWPPSLARIPEDRFLWLEMNMFGRKIKRISSVSEFLPVRLSSTTRGFYSILFAIVLHLLSLFSFCFLLGYIYYLASSKSVSGNFGHLGPTSHASWLF